MWKALALILNVALWVWPAVHYMNSVSVEVALIEAGGQECSKATEAKRQRLLNILDHYNQENRE